MKEILITCFFVLTIVTLNTSAQVLLKLGSGQGLLSTYLLGGLLTYGVSTAFYISVLSKLDLSTAYPLIIGLTIAATTLAGAVFLREQVGFINWMGIGLIVSGIFATVLGNRSF